MFAILFVVIFFLVGWITLMLPLSDSNSIQIILSVVMGAVAVNIVSSSVIINKLK